MNDQIQNPEVDTDEDATLPYRAPDWWQISAGETSDKDALDVVNSLGLLVPRLMALSDALTVPPNHLGDFTPRGIGYVLEDYARQLEDFGQYIYTRFRERPNPALAAEPAPAPKDPLERLREFQQAAAMVHGWGRESLAALSKRVREELAARKDAGERAVIELQEAEAIIAELEVRS
ncbi:MAG TPA: hypothetical protein PJ986_04105 [Gammaproteobacteria bacterium]|nr:hypothetical protein [Gammaproteobacteria bacterium]